MELAGGGEACSNNRRRMVVKRNPKLLLAFKTKLSPTTRFQQRIISDDDGDSEDSDNSTSTYSYSSCTSLEEEEVVQTQMQWTLTDLDLLDCPICLSPLSDPIFQCENGHVLCAQCCIILYNQCPTCSCPIGHLRCRWAEKLLQSLKLSCKYAEHGCIHKLTYNVKSRHENTCKHAPCSCPACHYIGSSDNLYTHFSEKHDESSRVIHFGTTIHVLLDNNNNNLFLREEGQKALFVLQHSAQRPYGSLLNVVYIAPTSSKITFSYQLLATAAENIVSFTSRMEPTQILTRLAPVGKYFIVPKYFANSSGRTELKLIISRGVDLDLNSE